MRDGRGRETSPDHTPNQGDPRNNADDAYACFMSMGDDEWWGLVKSLLRGGCLQVEEQKGFDRALKDRRP